MKTIILGCAIVVGLAACGNTFDDPLIVDGTRNYNYDSDLGACRRLAETHTQDEVRSTAIGGAVLGGLIGAIDSEDGDRADDALVGAVVGGGVGALEGQVEQDEARRTILIRCMQGRGHRVVA